MAVASFWTQEFLGEVVTALEVSLGRVTAADLQSDPKAAVYWERARQWLSATKRVVGDPTEDQAATAVPPFPLTGGELSTLQRAVDRAAQAHTAQKTRSKAERIVNEARKQAPVPVYDRLREGLQRVRISSWILAGFLALICVLNVAEWLVFADVAYRALFVVGVVLSLIGLVLWVRHYTHISNHAHYVEGIGAHI
jgi:hypothetical protein